MPEDVAQLLLNALFIKLCNGHRLKRSSSKHSADRSQRKKLGPASTQPATRALKPSERSRSRYAPQDTADNAKAADIAAQREN